MLTSPPPPDTVIYKITTADAWREAEQAGVLATSADDRRDGFVHLSAAHQAGETARRYFAGQAGLMLVAYCSGALKDALAWEASRGGDLFPHYYGLLPAGLALWAHPLTLLTDGVPDIDGAIAAYEASQ